MACHTCSKIPLPATEKANSWVGRRLFCTCTPPVIDPNIPSIPVPGPKPRNDDPAPVPLTLCQRYQLFCGWTPDNTPIRNSSYGPVYDKLATRA
jgi:hypothetical protein